MKKRALLCSLMILTFNTYAAYDILFENNTPHSVYIETGSVENLPSNVHGGWHNKEIGPYGRQKVQWFNFDEGIKPGHHYTFYVELKKKPNDKQAIMRFSTVIKGFLVGSSISEARVQSGHENKRLFKREPSPFYSKLVSEVLNHNPFEENKSLLVRAAAIKYTLPNPHKNIQLTDAISYVITQKQTQFEQNDNSNELALMTYNTQIWPLYGKVGGIIMNNPARRTEDIAARLKDYDVVAVQELFEKDYRAYFTGLLQPSLPYHVGPVSDRRPLSSGVVIYSRWPIQKEDSMVYKHCAGLDCGASKGASYAMINKYGVPYHIFSTHLQAGNESNGSFNEKDVKVRRQQLEALADFIQKQAIPADEAVIVMGDLNIDASSCYELNQCKTFHQLLNILQAAYHQHDNQPLLPFTDDPSRNWMNTGKERGSVEDYIFVLNHHRPVKTYHSRVLALRGDDDAKMYGGSPYGDTDLSDHFPVEAKLVF